MEGDFDQRPPASTLPGSYMYFVGCLHNKNKKHSDLQDKQKNDSHKGCHFSDHLQDRLLDRIQHSALIRADKASTSVDKLEARIFSGTRNALQEALSFLLKVEMSIEANDPRNILRKGFVLALDRNGIKIESAGGTRVGDRIQMMFADGTIKCGVVEIDRRSNIPGEEEASPAALPDVGS